MAQSGSNVLVTCRSSVRRRRTAASPAFQLELSTPSCRSNFNKAADQAHKDSTIFAAPKLPLVTSHTRPVPAGRPSGEAAVQAAATR